MFCLIVDAWDEVTGGTFTRYRSCMCFWLQQSKVFPPPHPPKFLCPQPPQFQPVRESDGPRLQSHIAARRSRRRRRRRGRLPSILQLPVPRQQKFLPSPRRHLQVPDRVEEAWRNRQLCGLWEHSQVRRHHLRNTFESVVPCREDELVGLWVLI